MRALAAPVFPSSSTNLLAFATSCFSSNFCATTLAVSPLSIVTVAVSVAGSEPLFEPAKTLGKTKKQREPMTATAKMIAKTTGTLDFFGRMADVSYCTNSLRARA